MGIARKLQPKGLKTVLKSPLDRPAGKARPWVGGSSQRAGTDRKKQEIQIYVLFFEIHVDEKLEKLVYIGEFGHLAPT